MSRRKVIQDHDAVSGGDQGIRTRSADVPGSTCHQNRAWLERHTESLRDGFSPFDYDNPFAPREEIALGICHAAMGDVIN